MPSHYHRLPTNNLTDSLQRLPAVAHADGSSSVAKLSLIQEQPPRGDSTFMSFSEIVSHRPCSMCPTRHANFIDAFSQYCWRPSWTVRCRDVTQHFVTAHSTPIFLITCPMSLVGRWSAVLHKGHF